MAEEDYSKDIDRYQSALSFKEGWVHIDFMDNIFVPNKSIKPPVVIKYPTNLHKEAHLMVSHPTEWIDSLIEANFERVIFHIESADDILETIEQIKDMGIKVGLAINGDTPIERLEPFMGKIDTVLIMSIIPGFQGQLFIQESLDKIKKIKSKNWPVQIAVDGAVNDQNARELVEAGADKLIIGSFLLKGDVDENLERIWEVIKG